MLRIFVSTMADGPMKLPDAGASFAELLPARGRFLHEHGLSPDQTTLLNLNYEGSDYCRYSLVNQSHQGDGITRPSTLTADALVTTTLNHALFLPLADCVGAVLHDPTTNTLMISHLGRHSLEQQGGTASVKYLANQYNVNPTNLTAWLSPAAGKNYYPLYRFNNRSLHEVAIEQLATGGVRREAIIASPTDSAADSRYFSHSQFLKGNRKSDGRFAIVAVMAP